VRIALLRGLGSEPRPLAASRNADRHLGGTQGTPLSHASVATQEVSTQARLSRTESEQQYSFQPVY
jgi:hypothetical protein